MKLHYNMAFSSGIFLVGFLLIINALPDEGLVYPQLINSGHALVFFFANLFLLKLLLGSEKTFSKILFISLFSILIGFLIECIQPYIGRERSDLDFYYDIIGVLFSAIIYIQINTIPSKPVALLLTLFICLAIALPVFNIHRLWKINHSNILLNFERDWESISLHKSEGVEIDKVLSMAPFKHKGHVGKVNFGMLGHYPRFGLEYPRSNWTKFTELSWEVASLNNQPINLGLRIHDAFHNQAYNDRFNYNFTIMPGLNLFKVALSEVENGPERRQMDMTKVSSIRFFTVRPSEEITVYFDNLELR